ncbi:hypothetical protein BV898_02940 [Hypsibius exemplaris]|uniref:Uncharacterized protein n=1 Tax=Hypsibius exemplaris TaxID=2072580 RepID=A0A1W0X6R2_HYPEX|nr:hypothetical protein BV898_02940 [Hypsibius exemplaris]
MDRRHGIPEQPASNRPPPCLTRPEKLKLIREMIRQNRLPVWTDPHFPHWTPPKLLRENLPDTRPNRIREEIPRQLQCDEVEIPFKQEELAEVLANGAEVLANGAEQGRQEVDQYLKTLPSELDALRRKTKTLTDRHEKEQREFVQTQYARQWKNSTGAEGFRRLEVNAHKHQSIRDLNEILFFKLLDDFEDYEVDAYFVKLGLDRAAKERAILDDQDRNQKAFERRGQDEVLAQLHEHLLRKQQEKRKRAEEQSERQQFEERLKFDAFKEKFDDHQRKRATAQELVAQKSSSYMGMQQREKLRQEAADTEAWATLMRKEAEDERIAIALEYKRHLDQDAYNIALVAASANTALDDYNAQYLKQQQLNALFNFLEYTKKAQGLRSRSNKEQQSQVDGRAAERKAVKEGKLEEQRQMDAERELERKRELERAAEKRAFQQLTARTLLEQAAEKAERERKLKEEGTIWAKNVERQRAIEDAYIKKLGDELYPTNNGLMALMSDAN